VRAERKVKTWSLLRKTPSVEVFPIASHGAHQQTDHGLAGDSAVDVKLPCADCDGGVEVRLLRWPFGGPNTSVASTHTWRQAACGGRGRRSVGGSGSTCRVVWPHCVGCLDGHRILRGSFAADATGLAEGESPRGRTSRRHPFLRVTPTPCVMLMPSMVVFALRRGGRLGPWCPRSSQSWATAAVRRLSNRGHQKIERVRSAARAHCRVVRPRVLARSRSIHIVWMRGDRLVAHGLDMTEVNAPSSGRHGGATSRGPTFACERKIRFELICKVRRTGPKQLSCIGQSRSFALRYA